MVSSCQQKVNPPVAKISIAISTTPYSGIIYVANEMGYFREEGLEVALRPAMYGVIALANLIAGEADFAACAETPFMFAALKGEGILAVAEIVNSVKDVAIVALRDRGVESPADLKGKRIGYPSGSTAQFFLDTFLTVHDVPKDSIKAIHIKPDEMGDALRAGKVDAVAIFQPYVVVFGKEFAGNAVTFYGETIYKSSFVVIAGKKFVAERPEEVKKFLRALLKAEAFVREHRSEALDIVARSIGKTRGEMDAAFQGFDFRVKLDQSLLVSLENQARWAIGSKLTDRKEVPNFLENIYLDGLKAVRPDVVTIVR